MYPQFLPGSHPNHHSQNPNLIHHSNNASHAIPSSPLINQNPSIVSAPTSHQHQNRTPLPQNITSHKINKNTTSTLVSNNSTFNNYNNCSTIIPTTNNHTDNSTTTTTTTTTTNTNFYQRNHLTNNSSSAATANYAQIRNRNGSGATIKNNGLNNNYQYRTNPGIVYV